MRTFEVVQKALNFIHDSNLAVWKGDFEESRRLSELLSEITEPLQRRILELIPIRKGTGRAALELRRLQDDVYAVQRQCSNWRMDYIVRSAHRSLDRTLASLDRSLASLQK